jgi:signal transduction histidine kinase
MAMALVFRAGRDLIVERANGAFQELFDLAADQGCSLQQVFRGASCGRVRRAVEHCLQDRAPVAIRITHGSRSEFLLLEVEARSVTVDGAAFALISASEARPPRSLASLGEADVLAEVGALSQGLVYIHDFQRGVVRCAAHPLLDRFGLSAGSIPATDVLQIVDPADHDVIHKVFKRQAAAADGEVIEYVCRLRASKGELFWAHVRSQVFARSSDGKVQRVLAVATDETEAHRHKAERAAAEHALAQAELNERRRIGRELHDSTAQLLLAARLGLNALAQHGLPEGEPQRLLEEARNAIDSAQREIRNFAFVLHPPALLEVGLEESVRSFATGFARRTGLPVTVQVARSRARLPFMSKVALFRVAQEALMNVYRHAHAGRAVVRLKQTARRVILEVEDDGVGIPEDRGRRIEGVGISGMRARMVQVGGAFELVHSTGGVLVRASVPTESAPKRAVRRATEPNPPRASGADLMQVAGSP